LKLTIKKSVANPSMRFSNKGSIASGVTSRPVNPVPPVVITTSIDGSAIQSRATAGVANSTYIFCLPGSPGACKDAWDEILLHQLDYRHGPCNFVEIMPRLDEHLRRPKAKGATV